MTLTVAVPMTRACSSHTPKWQRFQTSIIQPSQKVAKAHGEDSHPYMQQYSHVYYQRLSMLRPRCWKSVEENKSIRNNAEAIRVERILELAEGKPSIVVGTIVREPGDEKTTLHPESQCRSSDSLFLEDESGRVKLQVINKHSYPTGIVLAVQGTVASDGIFQVAHMYSPSLPAYFAVPAGEATDESMPTPHLLLVSGLHCGHPSVSSLPRDLLVSFLEGCCGPHKAASVSRIILAGGLTSPDPIAVKELDGFCLSLAATGIPLDILPGSDDPTTANWPQRPLHRSLLRKTDQYMGKLLSRTPNPYAALHEGKYVVGTDGTNVKDLCQFVLKQAAKDDMMEDDGDDAKQFTAISQLDALEQTLQWCHICPTGPDSLPTAPHATQDPMVLDEACPSIYFCGNANQFATRLCNDNKTRLVCVPKFSETGEAVLVNLETLTVEVLRFEHD